MANLHIIASTPNVLVMEYDRTLNPLREGLLQGSLIYRDGYIEIPEGIVGLGVELTDDFIRKYSYVPKDVHEKAEFEYTPH